MFNALKKLTDNILGREAMQPVAAFVARAGMRGLGINLSFRLEDSGEQRVLELIGTRRPGFGCLDVGANIGSYARAALAAGASKIVAFEPAPATFEKLRENTAGRAVEVHNLAVGETVGETELFVPANPGLASRDPEASGFARRETRAMAVPMTTIDEYCYLQSFFPALIKIDVEGFELEVLQGARRLLRDERRPDFIQFEFNTHHMHRSHKLDDFNALLPGYHLFRVTASGLSRIGAHRGVDAIYGYMNILASRDEKPFARKLKQ